MEIEPEVPASVRERATFLSQPKPMRRGSVSERTMKCGKAICPCQDNPKARHGPYYTLTKAVVGKTRSRYLSPEQAQVAKQQIDHGHEFRDQLEHYWEDCEKWADARLEGLQAPSTEGAEKGGSKRASKTKSSRKLKRSSGTSRSER